MLHIGTTGTETKFLAEADLPEAARLNRSISASEHERDMAEAMLQSTQGGKRSSRKNLGVVCSTTI